MSVHGVEESAAALQETSQADEADCARVAATTCSAAAYAADGLELSTRKCAGASVQAASDGQGRTEKHKGLYTAEVHGWMVTARQLCLALSAHVQQHTLFSTCNRNAVSA